MGEQFAEAAGGAGFGGDERVPAGAEEFEEDGFDGVVVLAEEEGVGGGAAGVDEDQAPALGFGQRSLDPLPIEDILADLAGRARSAP